MSKKYVDICTVCTKRTESTRKRKNTLPYMCIDCIRTLFKNKKYQSPPYKPCIDCKLDLPISAYSKNAATLDGYQSRCKKCVSSRRSQRVSSIPSDRSKECTICKQH